MPLLEIRVDAPERGQQFRIRLVVHVDDAVVAVFKTRRRRLVGPGEVDESHDIRQSAHHVSEKFGRLRSFPLGPKPLPGPDR